MSLRKNLEGPLALPAPAVEWLMDLWEVVQAFDDWQDGDEAPQKTMAMWKALVGMPSNPFFQANSALLLPVMSNAFLQWVASDAVEKKQEKSQLPKAYVWRASYYGVVLQVVSVVHGVSNALVAAPSVLGLYGETLESYLKEMADA